jgi:hypothetical protein
VYDAPVIRRSVSGAIVLLMVGAAVSVPQARQSRAVRDLLDLASRYVVEYEQQYWALALDEETVQWLERPVHTGSSLTRANPGGGMIPGGMQRRTVTHSDYVIVQAGAGRGWVPYRDLVSVNGTEMRDRDDRLVRLLKTGSAQAFEEAEVVDKESHRYDVGNVQRTINIPMFGLMLLHPQVRERFEFKAAGDEVIAGRAVERLSYTEKARPTLIKTSRGKDLALTGHIWIESSTGVIVKTAMTAADPIVRANVYVTFRRDSELGLWVPDVMEEFYKAALAFDDTHSVSTFTTPRLYQR